MQSTPGSLVTVRTLAPLVMFVTGIVTIIQGSLIEHSIAPLVLFGLGIPTLGTTAVAWMLARRRYLGAVLAVVGWAAAHLALAAVASFLFRGSRDEPFTLAWVASVVTFGLAIPGWAICAWFARRRELDAGDTLLGWAALWFGALQCVYIAMFAEAPAITSAWAVLAACVGVIAVAVFRAVSRRALCARVVRGQDAGWRIREPSFDEVLQLPPLFAIRERAPGVLEKVRSAHPSSAYRNESFGEPFALVPFQHPG